MVDGSLRVLQLLPPLKIGRHDLAEKLLKVALNTKINKIKTAVNFIYITSELSALIICRISFIYNRQVLNYMEIELWF